MEVLLVLLGISFILFFGFLAEALFKRFGLPDVLFLLGLGFLLGRPELFGSVNPIFINPARLSEFAPIFTTFTLLFIVYQGAFSVDLSSFARGLKKCLAITMYNFFLSAAVAFTIMYLFTNDPLLSLLAAFILGDVAQAFVIPVIEKLNISQEAYSLLNLEGTFSDVFVIVFSISVLEIMQVGVFDLSSTASDLFALFSIGFFVGIIAAMLWMVVLRRFFAGHGAYMLTIAFVILVYVFSEIIGGSGIVAVLFFGLVMRNANQLRIITAYVKYAVPVDNQAVVTTTEKRWGGVIPPTEVFFYSQISFFLTTFFFVYVGMVINIDNLLPVAIGLAISVGLMFSRASSSLLLRGFNRFDRNVISSLFPRGLAAAALAQEVILRGIPGGELVVNITYSVIVFSIVFSSINIFFVSRRCPAGEDDPGAPPQADSGASSQAYSGTPSQAQPVPPGAQQIVSA